MQNSTKSILALMVITLALMGGVALTQGATDVTEEINLDEDIQSSDLGIGEPTVLPDNPFYFLKNLTRGVRSFFTFNPIAKAELKEKFANERLIELKKMVEGKKSPILLERATRSYQKEVEGIKEITERIEGKAGDNERVERFLDKFTQHQALHQRILHKLEGQVPPEVFEKIKEAREMHLERFKDVMLKLEDKDKIPERLEENLDRLKGSKFKNFKNLEIFDDLKEKFPEDMKERIEQIRERMLERFREKLENLSPEEQERFKGYMAGISGDKIKHLDILGSLEGKELSEKLRSVIKSTRDKHAERLGAEHLDKITPERVKEQIIQAEKLLEKTKILIVEKDVEKEEMPAVYRLVEGAEVKLASAKEAFEKEDYGLAFGQATASAALSRNAIRIMEVRAGFIKTTDGDTSIVCAETLAPVCGINGEIYRNICGAKKARVKIAYRGECKAELSCAREGERVNRNPLLGSVSKLCCQVLEEIRTDKAYAICKKLDTTFECKTDQDCPLSRCSGLTSVCVEEKCKVPVCPKPEICIQVITPAKNKVTGECRSFPTPCDVPLGWVKNDTCPDSKLRFREELLKEGLLK
ncbi:MAG: DUF5667 domain-containing protein [Patescibacteria group bacterium]|nr:DUF5667 domain-containing protein [Patescibacteria group bacterium]